MSQEIVNVNLEELLRTGIFGAVEFGSTSSQVLKMLGEPDFTFTRSKNKIPIGFEYGDAELFFLSEKDNSLCGIYFDEFKIPKGNQRLNIDACWLKGTMSQAEVETSLTQAGIKFQYTEMPDSTMNGIITEGGITLGFIIEVNEFSPPLGLYNIYREVREEIEVFRK